MILFRSCSREHLWVYCVFLQTVNYFEIFLTQNSSHKYPLNNMNMEKSHFNFEFFFHALYNSSYSSYLGKKNISKFLIWLLLYDHDWLWKKCKRKQVFFFFSDCRIFFRCESIRRIDFKRNMFFFFLPIRRDLKFLSEINF